MAIALKRSDADVQAYLEQADRERAQRLEAYAVEALELGIAFEEGAEVETTDETDLDAAARETA